MNTRHDTLPTHGDTPTVRRIGLGLAALGRPAYHNLGHAQDLDGRTAREALEAHCHTMLDAAWDAGVRYVDVARSYGDGEAFLARWLRDRGHAPDRIGVGSKWGYTYVGDWRLDADVHEVKDHGLATFARQAPRSLELLGPWLRVYAIHSATLASGVLDDPGVLDALRRLRAEHAVRIGLSVTGPEQGRTIRRALAIDDGGLFSVVQATCNLLEHSVDDALAEAHARGWTVVAKETVANGRLTDRGPDPAVRAVLVAEARRLGTTADALALAWVLDRPHVDVALSGASTLAQLDANLGAARVRLDGQAREALRALAESPEAYWARRRTLPWT